MPNIKKKVFLYVRGFLITTSIFIGVAILYYFHWKNLDGFLQSVNFGEPLFCDFDRHYYPMGKIIFFTKFPVQGYFYSPLFAIIMHLFSKFDLPNARFLWGIVQAALILNLCFISGVYFALKEKKEFYFYLTSAAYLLSMPIIHGFRWGQISVLLVILIFGSMLLYKNGKTVFSALFLAFAAGIKYFPAVFLIYFLVKKDVKFIIWFFVFLLLFLCLVPGVALGFRDTIVFYKFVNHFISEAVSWLPKAGDSQFMPHVLYRITGQNKNFPFGLYKNLGIIVFVLNVGLGYYLSRKKDINDIALAYVFIFLTFPFIISTSWPHYFAYLPFCQIYVLQLAIKNRMQNFGKWFAVVPVVISFVLSSSVLFIMYYSWMRYSYYGILFFSNLFLLIGLYLSVSFCFKRKAAPLS